MRINYWPFGFALVALGLLLPWFDPVTTPRFNALNFPFAHSAYLWPGHFVLFSYGSAAIERLRWALPPGGRKKDWRFSVQGRCCFWPT